MDASLYTDGEYATFITFKEPVVRVAPWQNKEVAASITFPSTLLEPGPHHVKIGAVENPANRVTQGIAPRVGIEMKIKFDIPYPGKYARFQLDIPYINTGEKLPVTLTTKSLGKETINTIQGTITISNDEKIQSILPVTINSVQSEEEKSYHQVLTTENLLPGDYHAQASLTYDGIYGEANTDFRIGSRYVNVTNYTKTFEQGKIGEMIIAIAGRWNGNIDDVYATIDVAQEGRGITTLKTPSISLGPWESSILRTYIETATLTPGYYDIVITLHYLGGSTVEKGQILIYKKIHINTTYILIVAIALIVIIDILWLLRKRKS